MKRAGFVLLLSALILTATTAHAAEKQIGLACSSDTNSADWDTIAQCNGSTFQRITTFLANGLAINMGTTAPKSTSDISGNMTIGASYAGVTAAPANGMIVQGQVGIGTSIPNANAALDLSNFTNAALLPVGTTGQEPSCGTSFQGAIRFNSTSDVVEYCNGLAWTPFKPSGGPPGAGYFVISQAVFSGCLGAPVIYITASGTTATVTTATYNYSSGVSGGHDLVTGQSVTVSGATPSAFNGTFTITVTSPTTFTYTMASSPGSNDTTVGATTICPDSGGLVLANKLCLQELTSHTSWFGYKQANAAGLLNSSHVTAFLCDGTTCQNPEANTNYYFANTADSGAGGAYFTTNASGIGSNESADWSYSAYFGYIPDYASSLYYWTGRASTSNTQWSNSSAANTCSGWTTNSSSSSGEIGTPVKVSSSTRWTDTTYACSSASSSNAANLVCLVNP